MKLKYHRITIMNSVLFVIPLKAGSLPQYKVFANESMARSDEYKDMLLRYDIHSAQTWHKNIDGHDYIFVYHLVGDNFNKKMEGWDTSTHPFDSWFRESIMEVYDIENASGMSQPEALVNFHF